jgi:hypothetical protein
MPEFTFDAERHEYRLDGHRLPSVTELIRPLTDDCYANIPPAVLERARQRGQDVHLATELDDENDLDEETLDPEIAGYLAGWRKFKADTKARILFGEKPLYHPSMRYAGRPDRVVEIEKFNWLLDYKAVAEVMEPVHVQLCGYAMLLEPAWPIQKRAALHLRPDGTYRLIETPAAEIHDHTAAFYGLLATWQWKQKFGGKNGRRQI